MSGGLLVGVPLGSVMADAGLFCVLHRALLRLMQGSFIGLFWRCQGSRQGSFVVLLRSFTQGPFASDAGLF